MIRNEYKKILTILEDKINEEDEKYKRKEVNAESYIFNRNKFYKLYKLITNKYQNFFSEIDMDVALNILNDIGISKDELNSTYQNLIKEDISRTNYILADDIINQGKSIFDEEKQEKEK